MFGTQMREQIKRSMAGPSPEIKVGADTRPAIASIEALKTRMAALNDKLAKLRITADDKGAEAAIARTQAKLAALAKTVSSITLSADTTKLDAQIAAEKAKLAAFRQQASSLKMDANTTAALAKIAFLEKQAAGLSRSLKTMKGDINIAAAVTKLAAVQAELKVLKDSAEKTKLGADKKAIDAAITATEARIAVLSKQAGDIRLGGNVDTGALLAAEASLLGLEAAFGKTVEESAVAKTAMNAFFATTGKSSTFAAYGWKLLTGHITLFGGALNQVLPKMFTSVAVWHLLADAVIELVAVWAPAIIAVTAFGVAGADAAKEVYNRMVAVHTEMDATGRTIPQLGSGFGKLADAVRPEVYQLFGDALVVMGKRGGAFNTVAVETGRVLDQLAARFVLAVTSGSGVNKFMENAVNDVRLLGDSIGNLGGIFGVVFRAVPGYAEILLTVGDAITKVLEGFAQLAEPVIAAGLALHGFFIYGGAAVTVALALVASLVKVGASFGKFNEKIALVGIGNLKKFRDGLITAGTSIAGYSGELLTMAGAQGRAAVGSKLLADAQKVLTKIPTTVWVLAAATALASLVIAIARSRDAAQKFNDTLQETIQNAPLASVVTTIQQAQVVTAARLADTTRKLNTAIKENTVVNAGRAGALNSNGTAIQNLDNAQRHYTEGVIHLSEQQKLITTRFDLLSKAYGGNTAALGLLNAAGITTTQITARGAQAWGIIKVQVAATAKAYAAMGTQAGVLGNDLDVLGRTVTDQAQAVKKLNDAWGQFIGDVTGTQGAFDTVAQGFETLATHSGDLKLSLGKLKTAFADSASGIAAQGKVASATAAVASAQNSLNKLQKSGTGSALQLTAAHARLAGAQDRLAVAQHNLSAQQKMGVSAIDALTPAGIALNQAFGEQVVNIDKLFASWRTAGLAANLFTSGVKAAIAPLVKYATGSKEATAQLVALAQEAGYQGPISMQALTKWLGNTHGATKKLKDITNIATEQEALLTGAMSAQGDMIAGKLLGDLNNAILAYSGVGKAVTAYGTALARSGKGSDAANKAMTSAIAKLVQAGLTMGSNAQQLSAVVARTFGIEMPAAMKLVQNAMAAMVAGLPPAQKKFELFAISGLGMTRAEADKLWKKFAETNLAALAAKADTTRTKFDALASKGLGITRDQADQLWKHLRLQYLDELGRKGDVTKGKFINLAEKGLDYTRQQAQHLWDTLHRQQLVDAANKAGATRGSMEKLARQLGVTKGYVDRLWASLHKVAAGSPYRVTIHEDGTGLFTISGPGVKKSQGVGGSGNAAGGLAAGGYISGGTAGRDSVAAMLMPGEVVVPTRMVQQGAVDHLRGQLPGFAGGGLVRKSAPGGAALGSLAGQTTDFHNSFTSIMTSAMKAAMTRALKAAKAAAQAAANAAFSVSGAGPVGGDAGANRALARSMFPWPASQWPAFNTLEMHEAGYNRFARNASSGAYGIPQALPPTKMPFAAQAAGGSHAGPQLSWMFAYIRSRYGTPGNAWAKYYAHPGGVGWYAKGGMVPGMASGGTVAAQGRQYLTAWQTRHKGPYGLAIGPVVLNQQIAAMAAAAGRATTLSHAGGLSAGQHKFWARAAASEKRLLATYKKELTTERSWRYQVQLDELKLAKQIKAAGNLPALAGPVKGWKAQLARDRSKVAQISKMLGYSDAFIKAHPAAKPPRKVIPPGVPGSIPHAGGFTDNPADLIAQLFASLASNSRVVTLDSGGVIPRGLSAVWNGTGGPEPLIRAGRDGHAAGGGTTIVLENHGVIGSQRELEDWLVRSYDNLKRKRRI